MSLADLLDAEFVTPPYFHQLEEFETHANDPFRALAWTMRTGKSKATIDKACHLYKRGVIDGVLIFAPNGVHANWLERELPEHGWKSIRHCPLVWRSRIVGNRSEDTNAQQEWWTKLSAVKRNSGFFWLAVNSEVMTRPDCRRAIARFIKYRKCLAVFDESDDFGTPSAKRVKMARALTRRCPARLLLSGTLLDGSPLHAYSQFELLRPGILGFEFEDRPYEQFCKRYGVYEDAYGAGGRRFPKLVGFQNLDELREKIAPYMSVVLREDCADMPDLIHRDLKLEPTKQQRTIYNQLLDDFIFDLENGLVNVGERAPRFQKLQQVFSGFVIDNERKLVRIPGPNPRLDALAREVYLSPGKVIIWCNFQADIDFVKARLLLEKIEFVEYHGRVSDKRKQNALTDFENRPSIKALVGHAKAGGRGKDMSAASKVFWYSHTFSARMRKQAMERATKLGGKNIEVVDFLMPGPDYRIRSITNSRLSVGAFLTGAPMRDFLEGLRI